MSDGLNRVLLLGNLGTDPELRMTNGGQAVLKMRMVTNESYKDRDGNWKERAEWHNVVVWGKRAEGLGKILSKGSGVFVEGRLSTRSYESRDGGKRWSTEVVADNVILTGGRKQRAERSEMGGGSAEPPPTGEVDDIPFAVSCFSGSESWWRW